MKIIESAVQFQAAHTRLEHRQRRESLIYWQDPPTPRVSEPAISQAGKEALASAGQANQGAAVGETPEETLGTDDPKLAVLLLLIEKLTGRRIRLYRPNSEHCAAECPNPNTSREQSAANGAPPPQNDRLGWGMIYESHQSHYEAERTAFSANGLIRTADGREIVFSADLTMSREFYSETHLTVRSGDALKDPLVINFNGTAAQLTDTRFAFDIDLDGTQEQIAFLREGSGFLALDRNGDGMVNDGSELFGARSGDGFAELAEFDGDANQWIDEQDPVYERLRIWSRDAEGKDQLLALGLGGIGAIYLGRVETPFELNNAANEQQGAVRSTGIYLNENGTPGTVQQIDLMV